MRVDRDWNFDEVHPGAVGDITSTNGNEPSGESPKASTTAEHSNNLPERSSDGLRATRLADVSIRPTEYLLENLLAIRALNLVSGQGGMGKSLIVTDWAARATRGQLDGAFGGQPINVLWAGNEDGLEDVMTPRFQVAGADLSRAFHLGLDSESLAGEINIVADIDQLRGRVLRHKAKLLVIDPVVEYLPGNTDTHNDAAVRQGLRPIRSLAAELNIAVVGLVHFNKALSLDVATRIAASAGFRNAARSVLVVADHPEDEDKRILFQNKTNWGPETRKGRAYRLEGVEVRGADGHVILKSNGKPHEVGRVVWCGAIDLDPRSLPAAKSERDAPKRALAEEMLSSFLREAPKLRSKVEEQAALEDVGWRTVEAVAQEMGIETRQIPVPGKRGRGPSWWALPDRCEWSVTPPVYKDCGPLNDQKAQVREGSNEWSATSTGAEELVADQTLGDGEPDE